MKSKRAAKRPAFTETWHPEATCREVIEWTARVFPDTMLEYDLACRARNLAAMTEAVRKMRGIATRCDQFRRVQARKWAKDEKGNSNGEATSK